MISELVEAESEVAKVTISDNAVLLYEFQYKTVIEAATKLIRFSIIVFSVSSIITALTVFNTLPAETIRILLKCISVIVVCFILIGLSICYGIVSGLVQIRQSLLSISPTAFHDLGMERYFKRGILVICFVVFVSISGVFTIMFLVFSFLAKKGDLFLG